MLLSEPKKCHQDCLISTAWSMVAVGSALLNCGFSGNVPTSRYITARDQFYQPSPVLVLQVTIKCWDKKAWVRGYSTLHVLVTPVLEIVMNLSINHNEKPICKMIYMTHTHTHRQSRKMSIHYSIQMTLYEITTNAFLLM